MSGNLIEAVKLFGMKQILLIDAKKFNQLESST